MSEGLGIELFVKPDKHPFSMLEGMTHAMEAEQTMAFMLGQCVEAGRWIDVLCNHRHDDLVRREVIKEVPGPQFTYRITEKGKGLLYVYYGKVTTDERRLKEAG